MHVVVLARLIFCGCVFCLRLWVLGSERTHSTRPCLRPSCGACRSAFITRSLARFVWSPSKTPCMFPPSCVVRWPCLWGLSLCSSSPSLPSSPSPLVADWMLRFRFELGMCAKHVVVIARSRLYRCLSCLAQCRYKGLVPSSVFIFGSCWFIRLKDLQT